MEQEQQKQLCQLKETCRILSEHRLPRWEELPDFSLYMDQVLGLVNKYLTSKKSSASALLTSTMVNNYVKMGVLPPPEKKKYNRQHVAYLLAICFMKSALSIDSVKRILASADIPSDPEHFYNSFCDTYEKINQAVMKINTRLMEQTNGEDPMLQTVLCSALRAHAEMSLAQEALTLRFPPKTKPEKEREREKEKPAEKNAAPAATIPEA